MDNISNHIIVILTKCYKTMAQTLFGCPLHCGEGVYSCRHTRDLGSCYFVRPVACYWNRSLKTVRALKWTI
jgi:hypothetical protein